MESFPVCDVASSVTYVNPCAARCAGAYQLARGECGSLAAALVFQSGTAGAPGAGGR